MDHVGEKFEDQRVELDGNTFKNCCFVKCELVYSGSGETGLDECIFTRGSKLTFEGAALRTAKAFAMFAQPSAPTREAMLDAFPDVLGEDWRVKHNHRQRYLAYLIRGHVRRP